MQDQDGWYIARNDEQAGPVSGREMQEFIRLGYLKSEDLIWRPGFDNRQRAGDISVFLQLLPSPPGEEGAELPEHAGRPANNGAATVPFSQERAATEAGLSRLSESEFNRCRRRS